MNQTKRNRVSQTVRQTARSGSSDQALPLFDEFGTEGESCCSTPKNPQFF